MLVCRTRTHATDSAECRTRWLVRSERDGAKVRQRTLLNLGRHFELPRMHREPPVVESRQPPNLLLHQRRLKAAQTIISAPRDKACTPGPQTPSFWPPRPVRSGR